MLPQVTRLRVNVRHGAVDRCVDSEINESIFCSFCFCVKARRLRCFRLSAPAALPPLSSAVLLSGCCFALLSLLAARLHRCVFCCSLPQVLDLVSRSSRKDCAETLLCLAERASLLRVCAGLMLCGTTGRGLEICVTVSDLVLPHLCVCVCVCVCVCMSCL